MGKIADATFSGKSGKYNFQVYPMNTEFTDIGAVYIYTKRTVGADGNGTHEFLYIGETSELGTRHANHEKLACVKKHGGTCICVHPDSNGKSRAEKETDLRNGNKTPCNDQ